MRDFNPANLAPYIDHTILKPEATPEDIHTLCLEAKKHGFAAVCVNSCYVPLARKYLEGSRVKVCSVVGFPLGAMASEIKQQEAAWAVARGAMEIDMVIALGQLKAGNLDAVKKDVAAVHKSCGNAALKVIIETCLLNDDEKRAACAICKEIGVAFVKTSTGFAGGGATLEDVALMRAALGEEIGVKAAGGIRSLTDACAMIEAGATRLGTSSGVALVQGKQAATDC